MSSVSRYAITPPLGASSSSVLSYNLVLEALSSDNIVDPNSGNAYYSVGLKISGMRRRAAIRAFNIRTLIDFKEDDILSQADFRTRNLLTKYGSVISTMLALALFITLCSGSTCSAPCNIDSRPSAPEFSSFRCPERYNPLIFLHPDIHGYLSAGNRNSSPVVAPDTPHIAAVCSYWRWVSIQTPLFWASISTPIRAAPETLSLLQLFLQRSQNVPLSLGIMSGEQSFPIHPGILAALIQQTGRWAANFGTSGHTLGSLDFPKSHLSIPLNRLHSKKIFAVWAEPESQSPPSFAPSASNAHLKWKISLSSRSVKYGNFLFVNTNFPNLKRLQVVDCDKWDLASLEAHGERSGCRFNTLVLQNVHIRGPDLLELSVPSTSTEPDAFFDCKTTRSISFSVTNKLLTLFFR
ncbi:hypothetical protein C8R47DRAFT_1067904 [Mycena vitilis]|nr:hypothetical protein C8R47DRAFT_1067904 [Mycena vitilis]